MKTILDDFENKLNDFDKKNTAISNSNVGWHMYHCSLIFCSVFKVMEKSDPNNFKPKFSIPKLIVMTLKTIPRGKAKAPKVALPPEKYDKNEIAAKISEAKEALRKIKELPENRYFTHPIFGDIKQKNAIKFLGIHSNHHLKIINDIIKN